MSELTDLLASEAETIETAESIATDPAYQRGKAALSARNKNLQIRLSEAELAALQEAAADAGEPVSGFARRQLLAALAPAGSKEALALRIKADIDALLAS